MSRDMMINRSLVASGDTKPWTSRGRLVLATVFMTLAVFAFTTSTSAAAEPARSAQADGLLKKMSDFMSGLKSFSVDTTNTMEYIDTNGQKLDFGANGKASVMRPDRLVAHRVDLNQDDSVYYDGKTVTVYAKQQNFYATAPVPANLDDALDFMRDLIQIDLPGADLLYSDIYKGMTWNETSSSYVGKESIGGKSVDHLAFRTPEIDFQIWIQDGDQPLPMRYLITSKWVTGAPQYGVEMSHWVVNPKLDPKIFEFKAPAGATKIDFLTSQGAKP
ncbi:MAG: DUF2092 domain-containing protein [Salinisphaera sp.]|uniref:DUF2092 domain-containing protein n=1 Tax=Salinisphaera sp. TaxID=1914330 RepID=UPI003C7AB82D